MRRMGPIFQRQTSAFRWIAYFHQGREIRESAESTDKKAAERFLKRRLGEIHGRRFIGPKEERIPFSALLDGLEQDYQVNGRKSLSTLPYRLKPIRAAFALLRAVDVDEARLPREGGRTDVRGQFKDIDRRNDPYISNEKTA
ncbi:MAG: hypothetical protein HY717_06130 [Planctomycetes bacterium]|nr:hypothetical protein [Planctomycetota bacterium]